MLLAHDELWGLVQAGVITNVTKEMVNSSSIDVTLGAEVLVERVYHQEVRKSLRHRHALNMDKHTITEGVVLAPNAFMLACTEQVFNLPRHISADYKLKSSMARLGLENLNAGWCDAGWNGSVLTLELKNMTQYHSIILRPGDRIGQVVFYRHDIVAIEDSYASRGRYNGDRTVSGVKE